MKKVRVIFKGILLIIKDLSGTFFHAHADNADIAYSPFCYRMHVTGGFRKFVCWSIIFNPHSSQKDSSESVCLSNNRDLCSYRVAHKLYTFVDSSYLLIILICSTSGLSPSTPLLLMVVVDTTINSIWIGNGEGQKRRGTRDFHSLLINHVVRLFSKKVKGLTGP